MLDNATTDKIRKLRNELFDKIGRGGPGVKDARELHAICESALNEMCNPTRRAEAISLCLTAIDMRKDLDLSADK